MTTYDVEQYKSRRAPAVYHVWAQHEDGSRTIIAECPYFLWANQIAAALQRDEMYGRDLTRAEDEVKV